MSSSTYVVTAPCVQAKVNTDSGDVVQTFYAGAFLPAGVSKDALEHLLSIGLIREAGGNADTVVGALLTADPASPVSEVLADVDHSTKASGRSKS